MSNEISIFHFTKLRDSDFGLFLDRIPLSERLTVCVDIEDSITDFFNPQNSFNIKKEYRRLLYSFFSSFNSKLKFGIRVNSILSPEFNEDLELLTSLRNKFNSVFVPKCKSHDEVSATIFEFEKNKIGVNNFIPIIECSEGLQNLNDIVSKKNPKVKMIAFGHCDYNLNQNIFPFKHQEDEQYWKWVNNFYDTLKNTELGFINSPYLKLEHNYGFIRNLKRFTGYNFSQKGQITLTTAQINLCLNLNNHKSEDISFTKSKKLNRGVFAKSLLNNFKKDFNIRKGFSIKNNFGELISPQEYIAAKKFMNVNY
ncbi:MAG TPA: aldolase/citrate lyase family protein [Ignavibacteria bacterium]|nr:aldolase/citrate lyase family protein [Ignavibacteria bacterium]